MLGRSGASRRARPDRPAGRGACPPRAATSPRPSDRGARRWCRPCRASWPARTGSPRPGRAPLPVTPRPRAGRGRRRSRAARLPAPSAPRPRGRSVRSPRARHRLLDCLARRLEQPRLVAARGPEPAELSTERGLEGVASGVRRSEPRRHLVVAGAEPQEPPGAGHELDEPRVVALREAPLHASDEVVPVVVEARNRGGRRLSARLRIQLGDQPLVVRRMTLAQHVRLGARLQHRARELPDRPEHPHPPMPPAGLAPRGAGCAR